VASAVALAVRMPPPGGARARVRLAPGRVPCRLGRRALWQPSHMHRPEHSTATTAAGSCPYLGHPAVRASACYRAPWRLPGPDFTGRRRRASDQVMIAGQPPTTAMTLPCTAGERCARGGSRRAPRGNGALQDHVLCWVVCVLCHISLTACCSALSRSLGSTSRSSAVCFTALVTAFCTASLTLLSPTTTRPAWPGSI
jgi:hypothetical protein